MNVCLLGGKKELSDSSHLWKNVRVVSVEVFTESAVLLGAENTQHPSVSVSFFLKYGYVMVEASKFEIIFGNARFKTYDKFQTQPCRHIFHRSQNPEKGLCKFRTKITCSSFRGGCL